MFPVFTTFKLKREQTRRSFRCSFRPVPRGNRFNPFLVSDSAQWTFVADLCRCLIVYVDLSLLHSKPVNTRKAFVCEKNCGAFLFLFVISTFDSAGDIWKHNKNKNLNRKRISSQTTNMEAVRVAVCIRRKLER